MSVGSPIGERVLSAVDRAADEIIDFTSELIRIPTVNPPGEAYEDCARVIGDRLASCGFEVDYAAAEGRPEHTRAYPRVNVIGLRRGRLERPAVHLNGHLDVVPAGDGWTVDPFGGTVKEGRIYGRGACDMKAGIVAAIYAAEAIRRAGIALNGTVEISATVDEESGGFAGVAWLAEHGRITRDRLDYVIIPEPLGVDRICVGHRGVYWFEIETHGHTAHGSMPFLGVSAIDQMSAILERVRHELVPALASRTTEVPVVPDLARHPTININALSGGQPIDGIQTPCVAGSCRAIFDRRFLLEEGYDATRDEIEALLRRTKVDLPSLNYELRDLMIVHPVRTPERSPLVAAMDRRVHQVTGRAAIHVASPGTYDHKHVDRIGGIKDCVAYGPGVLELAHQPDEWCGIDDLIDATKVLALTILELTDSL